MKKGESTWVNKFTSESHKCSCHPTLTANIFKNTHTYNNYIRYNKRLATTMNKKPPTCAIATDHAATVTAIVVIIITVAHEVRRGEDRERVRARPTTLLARQHRR